MQVDLYNGHNMAVAAAVLLTHPSTNPAQCTATNTPRPN